MISEPMQRLQSLFEVLTTAQGMDLTEIYSTDVVFRDPFHTIHGRDELQAYFEKLNKNVDSCRFEFDETVESEQSGFVTWTMTLKLRVGARKPIVVEGTTHVRYRDGKICYHRDYFDGAELVYEHVPVLGTMIRSIRKRV